MDNPRYQIARTLEILPETADTATFLFALEDQKELRFLPGQFNMLGLIGVEEAPISFSSLAVPGSNRFAHTIRKVGNVTRLIGELEPGRRIIVRGPYGRGWPIEKLTGRDLLIVAGGIGLAPVKPLLLYALENRNRIRNLVLVYGARTPDEMIFRKELAAWQERQEITTLYCVDRLDKESSLCPREGLVTQFLEDLELNQRDTITCICGPEIMMRFVARKLAFQGYPEDQLFVTLERRMRCGIGHCGHCQIGSQFVCQDGPVFSYPVISRFADTLL